MGHPPCSRAYPPKVSPLQDCILSGHGAPSPSASTLRGEHARRRAEEKAEAALMASFADEAAVTRRLLDVVGIRSLITDPKETYGRETDADVEIVHAGRKVGLQVTDFCADEGVADPRRGLRATEKRNAARGRFPAYFIPWDQRAALRRRVVKKITVASRYGFEEFHELWLLVASLARADAAASTFIVPQLLNADDLNHDLDADLGRSNYARAYVHIEVGDTVYEWTREGRWHLVCSSMTEREPSGPTGEPWFMQYLRDPGLVGEVRLHPKVIEKACAECGGPFTREQPRREPASSDGRYVHADQEYCTRLQRVTVWRMP